MVECYVVNGWVCYVVIVMFVMLMSCRECYARECSCMFVYVREWMLVLMNVIGF